MAASSRPLQLAVEHNYLTPASSPKRKRNDEFDNEDTHRTPTRLRMELPTRSRLDDTSSPTSPRSKVSRQLHALSLNKPDLAFSAPVAAFGQNNPNTPESWSNPSPPGSEVEPAIVLESPLQITSQQHLPGTPILEPTVTTDTLPVSPIPLPGSLPDSMEGSRARARSPPLSTSFKQTDGNGLTWTEAEITGHNPTDPLDDGTGMNGIGFRPTPAMAYARSRRRKQQVAEYNSRESKEARQKRIDRRRKVSSESEDQALAGRRVRFIE